MNAASLPLAALADISIQTALLVVLAGALLFIAKAFVTLRARIEALERRPQPNDAATPALAAPAPATLAALPKTPAAAPATTPGPADAMPAEVFAVIAAAVHATLKGRVRIVGITSQMDDRGWSLEGRRQIFHSHKVR